MTSHDSQARFGVLFCIHTGISFGLNIFRRHDLYTVLPKAPDATGFAKGRNR